MLPKSIQNLIDQFSKLPGIGPRMAARLTFYLLTKPKTEIQELARALERVTAGLQICSICGNMSEETLCTICQNDQRNETPIIIVEEPLDVVAFERAAFHKGKYHVLGGVISPINGVGPEHLRIQGLVERVKKLTKEGETEEEGKVGNIEIIIATNPSLEGEATASYIGDLLAQLPIKISRIARGLPMGSEIEFADPTTLHRALEGRRQM
ncbi:MAG: recombination protein RecR [uncultured bacterium]|nr:MAG: recombination protein RecR [uncultured bacterium]